MARERLKSVDALRGFDMFWIIGAEGVFAALLTLTGWQCWQWFAEQMQHSVWQGITFYDVIFPLFIFLSGVTIGLTAKRIGNQPLAERKPFYVRSVKRLAVFFVLGIVYNHGWGSGVPLNLDDIRYASVLFRIGLVWFVVVMLAMHFNTRVQYWLFAMIALGYPFAQWLFNPVEPFTNTTALNVYIDKHFLPGITYLNRDYDPEGILSSLGALLNGLAGAWVGRRLQSDSSHKVKLIHLFGFGVASWVLAIAISPIVPMVKDLWTVSFALASIGISSLLLGLFYLLIDVLKWQRWAQPFMVIGMNAIIIYLFSSLMDWGHLAQSLFGGSYFIFGANSQALMQVVALVFVQWVFLYLLYKKNIFIKF